jgi:predicted XRE-type DNA-binding protein
MNKAQREAVGSSGWQVSDVGDFLDISDAEVRVLDLRISVVNAIKQGRERSGLTQKQLAELLGTSQPRVARIESPAAADVSLDQRFQALFAVGSTLADLDGLPTEVTGETAVGQGGPADTPGRRGRKTKSAEARR